MYSDANEALHRLFDVVEAATDRSAIVDDLALKVARVDALDRRLRQAASKRTHRLIDNTQDVVVLLGKRLVEAYARDLLKAWEPTGLLDAETSPFDLRRPLSDGAIDPNQEATG